MFESFPSHGGEIVSKYSFATFGGHEIYRGKGKDEVNEEEE